MPNWFPKPCSSFHYLRCPPKHHPLQPSSSSSRDVRWVHEIEQPEKSPWWGCSVNLWSCLSKGKSLPRLLRCIGKPDNKNTEKAGDKRLDVSLLSIPILNAVTSVSCAMMFQMPLGKSDFCDCLWIIKMFLHCLPSSHRSLIVWIPRTQSQRLQVVSNL